MTITMTMATITTTIMVMTHQDPHDVNRHDASIRSFSIVEDKPIEPMALEMFIDLLRSAHGEKLLRMKAIVPLRTDRSRPLVLHGVQNIFHPPVRLPAWPDPVDRRTRMVLITKDLPEDFVKDLFDAFLGKPRHRHARSRGSQRTIRSPFLA